MARSIFVLSFLKHSKEAAINDILYAFKIGMQFDCRLAVALFLPLLALTLLPWLNVTRISFLRYITRAYLWAITLILILIYAGDFGYFDYVNHRMDIAVLDLLKDTKISLLMILQSYPIIRISLVALVLGYGCYRVIKWIDAPLKWERTHFLFKEKTIVLACMMLLYLLGAWQSFGKYALRWDKAFFSENAFLNAVALNPVLFMIDTYKYQDKEYDKQKVSLYDKELKTYLGIQEEGPMIKFNYRVENTKTEKPKNMMIVMLETFPAKRLKIHGNTYNPAPFLNQLAENSLYFEHTYAPMWNTGVAIFSLISSVPDVGSTARSSSRNPYTSKQNSIINQFDGYEKYYFSGGSTDWANIRGFLRQNIKDIQIYDENSWEAESEDTWGVSDYDMFEEINKLFKEKDSNKPFFAFIQTGSNHRPYTIAKNAKDFKVDREISENQLKEAGFMSRKEYNALRLLDFSIEQFVKGAIEAGYGKETIFCFVGDHGTTMPKTAFMTKRYIDLDLNENHVPLIFYEPGKPHNVQKIKHLTTLSDIVPILANLAGISYQNKTMGRDLLKKKVIANKDNMVIMADKKKAGMTIKVIGETFLLSMDNKGENTKLYQLHANDVKIIDVKDQNNQQALQYKQTGSAIYEASKYLLYNAER
ncbi:MAG: sulfatase-like hydrolase/transferase [bacterium]